MLSFILLRSVYLFYYWCLFWSADFPFFWIWFTVSIDNTNSFLDLVSDVIFIFFPIWDPVPLQSERQLCTSTDLSMIHHWIGSITVLITRMRKFIGFDSFACQYRPPNIDPNPPSKYRPQCPPPYINLQVLYTVFFMLPMVLIGRICLIIKRFLTLWLFPLFSWP